MTKEEFFDRARFEYTLCLDSLFNRCARKIISEEEANRERYRNLEWFSLIRQFVEAPQEVCRDDLSQECLNRHETEKDFPLCSVIFYHGCEIPVYDDDYGQQVFAKYHGQTWSGGSYNLGYVSMFCTYLDHLLEDEEWQADLQRMEN